MSVFTNNTISGNTILNVVNNGIQGIESSLISKFIAELYSFMNSDIKLASLVCTGEAKWDWEECKTTFIITSLKPMINGEEGNNIINENIDIKKTSIEGDIKEHDVLIQLLQNNKLFYDKSNGDGTSTKYVFNSVDLSGMKYYCFLSKYVDAYYLDFIYCLKCALNGIKYNTYLGHYNYHANFLGLNTAWLNSCNCSSTSNAYGNKETYYNSQLNFLDREAGEYTNRILYSYTDKQGQELCTKDDLKKGWKNQSA